MVWMSSDARWIAEELLERLKVEIADIEHDLCCGQLPNNKRFEAEDDLKELRRLMDKAREIANSD